MEGGIAHPHSFLLFIKIFSLRIVRLHIFPVFIVKFEKNKVELPRTYRSIAGEVQSQYLH